MTSRIFEYIDQDKNGLVEGEEIEEFMRMMNAKSLDSFSSLLSHLSESEQ